MGNLGKRRTLLGAANTCRPHSACCPCKNILLVGPGSWSWDAAGTLRIQPAIQAIIVGAGLALGFQNLTCALSPTHRSGRMSGLKARPTPYPGPCPCVCELPSPNGYYYCSLFLQGLQCKSELAIVCSFIRSLVICRPTMFRGLVHEYFACLIKSGNFYYYMCF